MASPDHLGRGLIPREEGWGAAAVTFLCSPPARPRPGCQRPAKGPTILTCEVLSTTHRAATSEKKALGMKRMSPLPIKPAQHRRLDFPNREPLSSCQPGYIPLALAPCFLDLVCPVYVLCLNPGWLSLVLRLGTHCACFHGHWEALNAMCFKGILSPPRLPAACPRECTMRGSSARPLTRLPGGRPSLCQGRLPHSTRTCSQSLVSPLIDVYSL